MYGNNLNSRFPFVFSLQTVNDTIEVESVIFHLSDSGISCLYIEGETIYGISQLLWGTDRIVRTKKAFNSKLVGKVLNSSFPSIYMEIAQIELCYQIVIYVFPFNYKSSAQ